MSDGIAEVVRPAVAPVPPSGAYADAVRAAFWIGLREVKLVLRQPAVFWPNLAMPVFFYFVMIGSLSGFAESAGIANWEAFQIPIGILIAVQSGGMGFQMVNDIENGYFDKLLATPIPRFALLVGSMGADFVRVLVQGAIVAAIALAAGATIATGVPGAVIIILMGGAWGIAFSAIGYAIAIKTGSAQATQSVWALFIPFFFLTTSFAPLEALAGWLRIAATYNPMTYLLRSMRSLTMVGWDGGEFLVGLAAVGGFGVVTFTMAMRAMRARLHG